MPFARRIMDVFRLLVIYFVFSSVVSHFWMAEFQKQMNYDYLCFKDQMVVDLAAYYYRNGTMPSQLSDFTGTRVNPFNQSPLRYQQGEGINITITDDAGNTVVRGFEEFIGLKINSRHPEDFFWHKRTMGDILCHGNLVIPPEYQKKPSWRTGASP